MVVDSHDFYPSEDSNMKLNSSLASNGVTVITCHVENLDASNVKSFKEAMQPLLKDQSRVVLNLADVKFVDSSGLGALISALREVNGRDGSLKLCALTRSVRALFELMRMNRIFSIYESQEEAVASYP
jgi:anti-sigma B factor antagonist